MRTNFYGPLHQIKLSPIVKIAEQASRFERSYQERTGKKFIHLERGELNMDTPILLIQKLHEALNSGKTKYPKSSGEPALKEEILAKLNKQNNISGLEVKDIVVTAGGQESLNIAFSLFTNQKGAGFSPIWSVAIENFVPYSNIDFLEVPLNPDFSVDWALLENSLKNISFFYFNNPQNPSGKVFTYDEVNQLVRLCKKYGVFIISDEAYEAVMFDGNKHISTLSVEEAQDYPDIVSAFTFSKTFAATGLRAGYMVSRNDIVISIAKGAQYTHTAGVPTFIQYGLAGFNEIDLKPLLAEFQSRRDLFFPGLKSVEGLKVLNPEGAFYFFPDAEECMKRFPGKDINEVLMDHGMSVVPGYCFSKNNHFRHHFRISFSAIDQDDIREVIRRLNEIFG